MSIEFILNWVLFLIVLHVQTEILVAAALHKAKWILGLFFLSKKISNLNLDFVEFI